MAAGLGFKDFSTGEVLTAADVDGYLMQGVWVFASAAARDAAVTSPQEGNFAYLKDTNVTTYYTGSAWANLDTTGMTNPMTTTGDTIYSSSGSTPARLGIGSTGQVLTVAGGIPSWATAAGGGANWSLLNSGGTALTGAQKITVSGISGKDKVAVFVKDATSGNASSFFSVTFNDDTDVADYLQIATVYTNNTSYNSNQFAASPLADGLIYLSRGNTTAASMTHGSVIATGCNAAGAKVFTVIGGQEAGDVTGRNYLGQGYYLGTSTITEINVKSSSGNFNGGTVFVYTSA